jgi:hypothetical protein
MTNSEVVAYQYGRRLAQGATRAVQEGNGKLPPAECMLTEAEQASLDRLGRDAWWALALRGGQDVLGGPDAVPKV